MNVTQIQKNIVKLPHRSRGRLIRSILDKEMIEQAEHILLDLEDYLDAKRHLELLEKGEFEPWKEVKKRLHTKSRRH